VECDQFVNHSNMLFLPEKRITSGARAKGSKPYIGGIGSIVANRCEDNVQDKNKRNVETLADCWGVAEEIWQWVDIVCANH
jgi:hypothetical protein